MSLKLTLLETVQSVLSSLDSDSVSTVGETIESEQVTLIVQEVYYKMATYQTIPHFNTLLQLDGLADLTKPTVMRIPDCCTDIENVRYRRYSSDGTSFKMATVEYCDKITFLDMQLNLDTSDTSKFGNNVFDGNIKVPYSKVKNPVYFTAFDEDTIVFDGHMEAKEATMNNDSSLVTAYVVPDFFQDDNYVIPLPDMMRTQFLADCKEQAFEQLKQSDAPRNSEISNKTENRNRLHVGAHDGINGSTVTKPSWARKTRRSTRRGR